ncbi:hypothetical protein BDQ17DRAFT_1420092 [Cyathus striatus]|nr:hypothetical protein BDQ17DRAFT_1420092 [Cyathus striatus]
MTTLPAGPTPRHWEPGHIRSAQQHKVSYVAGNAFLDSLVAHRRSIGLAGTSFQLGPWESKIIQSVDPSLTHMRIMSHQEGIPLLLQALSDDDPVQSPGFASDAISRELRLNSASKGRIVKKTHSSKQPSNGEGCAGGWAERSLRRGGIVDFVRDGLDIVCTDAGECAGEAGRRDSSEVSLGIVLCE